MPQDAATPTAVRPSLSAAEVTDAPPFPADARTLALRAADLALGGTHTVRFTVRNPYPDVLHVRFSISDVDWLTVTPSEAALGPEESQVSSVLVDVDRARAALKSGATPVGRVLLAWQHLFPTRPGTPPTPVGSGAVYVRLPLATCPSCGRVVDEDLSDGIPETCPYCFERLRPCPVCGAPCSWLARHCPLDPSHVVRASPDWGVLGGDPAHTGVRESPHARGGASAAAGTAGLSRRWSFPSVAPARRDQALHWSAPVAAYGLVAAAAATHDGETHLFAFDAVTGAPLWEAYPLPDPVYPERGGAAIADGTIFVATVDGACVAVDALRGTRRWETALRGRVYGAVVPVTTGGDPGRRLLLVPGVAAAPGATSERSGCLYIIDAESGAVRREVSLAGPPDSAPAYAEGRIFVHDDSGTLTAIDAAGGDVLWTAKGGAGFDGAPVVHSGRVYSGDTGGAARCHDAATGELLWEAAVTNSPFSGTPACDGTLLYLPADDGLHIVSAPAGRAVRRYGLRRPVRSAPVLIGGTLYFGGTDGVVYSVDGGRTPERAYETGTGSQIVGAPAFADGALFVTATNGVLYALSPGAAASGSGGGVGGEGGAEFGQQQQRR